MSQLSERSPETTGEAAMNAREWRSRATHC
jgi:hypothetical protein